MVKATLLQDILNLILTIPGLCDRLFLCRILGGLDQCGAALPLINLIWRFPLCLLDLLAFGGEELLDRLHDVRGHVRGRWRLNSVRSILSKVNIT